MQVLVGKAGSASSDSCLQRTEIVNSLAAVLAVVSQVLSGIGTAAYREATRLPKASASSAAVGSAHHSLPSYWAGAPFVSFRQRIEKWASIPASSNMGLLSFMNRGKPASATAGERATPYEPSTAQAGAPGSSSTARQAEEPEQAAEPRFTNQAGSGSAGQNGDGAATNGSASANAGVQSNGDAAQGRDEGTTRKSQSIR